MIPEARRIKRQLREKSDWKVSSGNSNWLACAELAQGAVTPTQTFNRPVRVYFHLENLSSFLAFPVSHTI